MFSPLKYLFVLLFLLLLFTAYNYTLYTTQSNYGTIRLSEKALQGEKHWLENNCNSCHQLYGLGGYLGPDLTNVYSFRKKNGHYLKAMFNSGTKAMPTFNFNKSEKEELLEFLMEVDQTGMYPNTEATIKPDGWVKVQYKKETYEN